MSSRPPTRSISPEPHPYVLQTERLFLRELSLADVDALHSILGDAETMRFYPSAKTREETVGWIEWCRASYAEHGFGLWGLVLREPGEFIGDCGLTVQAVDGERLVEVGYHVKKTHWRRGLATEAALACRDHAFARLGVDRLIALIRPENIPSRRVAEKLGMRVWKQIERAGMPHVVYAMDGPPSDPASSGG